MDKLIERLKEQQARDEESKRQMLEDIEAKRIPRKHGMQMIESL